MSLNQTRLSSKFNFQDNHSPEVSGDCLAKKNQRCLSLKLLYFILDFLSIFVNLIYHLIVCYIPNGGDFSCFILFFYS